MSIRTTLPLFLCLALPMGAPCPAAAAEQPPTDALRTTTDKLLAELDDPNMAGEENREACRNAMRDILRDRFALRQMARLTVATDAWKQAGEQQRTRFFDLFQALLERTYLDQIEGYKGQKVVYDDETVRGQTGVVSSRIKRDDSADIRINYRVLRRKDRWVVYDVVIDDVSVIKNYREQFADILKNGSFDDLLAKLEEKDLD